MMSAIFLAMQVLYFLKQSRFCFIYYFLENSKQLNRHGNLMIRIKIH